MLPLRVVLSPSFIWFRLIWNPLKRGHARRMYRRHRGDVESQWWCPALGERVLTCDSRIAVTLSVDFSDGMAWVHCTDDGVKRSYSWTDCLEPLAKTPT